MEECIFCKIVAKEIPSDFLCRNEHVVAFADLAPLAPVHILIIPRQHIASMNDMTQEHATLLSEMLLCATRLAKEKGIADDGYKLLIRTGAHGGQEVPHVHLHLIGGAPLAEKIEVV